MHEVKLQPPTRPDPIVARGLAAWAVVAAFGTYFCMYAFRKPFTAATYDGGTVWGLGEKSVLVTAQVLGYMTSKFIGIRVVAEMPPQRRAAAILALIGLAEAALLGFAFAPSPLHVACLFLNGLPLGMVFGLVIGFLEGRRNTEALAAGLCASFIMADGVTKSIGTWLLGHGASERGMPGLAGLIFLPPLAVFVWMLARIPPPDPVDVAHRSERMPMDRRERRVFLMRHGPGLAAIVGAYLLVTIARSLRNDIAPEIWRGLGTAAVPSTFATSEGIIALAVLAISGLSVLIIDNRRAFFSSIGVALAGAVLMMTAIVVVRGKWLDPLGFMVLMGLGLYLPYVAVHTTIFERLIAMTRDRGNLGFLMSVADSMGYLAYAVLMIGKGFYPVRLDVLPFFLGTCQVVALLTGLFLVAAWVFFARRAVVGQPEGVSS
jgi:hypothetical protein